MQVLPHSEGSYIRASGGSAGWPQHLHELLDVLQHFKAETERLARCGIASI
jgi:hypothetical protein